MVEKMRTEQHRKASRIMQDVLAHLRINTKEMARKLGTVTPEAIRRVVNGTNRISPAMARSIVANFPQISYDYLRVASPRQE